MIARSPLVLGTCWIIPGVSCVPESSGAFVHVVLLVAVGAMARASGVESTSHRALSSLQVGLTVSQKKDQKCSLGVNSTF